MEIVNGMSSTKLVERALIRTAGLDVRDIEFIDDIELLIAVSDQGK